MSEGSKADRGAWVMGAMIVGIVILVFMLVTNSRVGVGFWSVQDAIERQLSKLEG